MVRRTKGLSKSPRYFRWTKYSLHGKFYCTGWTYPGGEKIIHVPLMKWAKENFLSRSQVERLIKKRILFVTRHKGRFLVAVKPEYSTMSSEELLELAQWL